MEASTDDSLSLENFTRMFETWNATGVQTKSRVKLGQATNNPTTSRGFLNMMSEPWGKALFARVETTSRASHRLLGSAGTNAYPLRAGLSSIQSISEYQFRVPKPYFSLIGVRA